MQRCLDLAKQGLGNVAPNPMVGCVIVHKGEIIGEGYHEKYGEAHAEVNAINSVKDQSLLSSSTLYVNLEPCAHYGKTPPCADLIVSKKIKYVVIGSIDKNVLVSGKGIEKIIKAGVDVKTGVLEDECKELNKRFFTFHEKKRPYIILKWAQTDDGFIDHNRNLQQNFPLNISSIESKKLSHKWRSEEQAIIVGTNTALKDNPKLTVRNVKGKNPLRILIDKDLKIPKDFYLLDNSTETIVFTGISKEKKSKTLYIKIDLNSDIIPQILNELYKKEIQSVIVEGGEKLLNSFIKSGLWDEARVFTSPEKISAGISAPLLNIKPVSVERIGNDELKFYRNL